jgi:hypothetical protein
MPTPIDSITVITEKHIVDGEGLGDDGDEDGVEIPLSTVKGRQI